MPSNLGGVSSSSTWVASSGSISHRKARVCQYTRVLQSSSHRALCTTTNFSAHLEVSLFLFTEWIKLYVDQFLSIAEELATYERRQIASIFNYGASDPYNCHQPMRLFNAITALSTFSSIVPRVGPSRFVKATHFSRSILDS